MADGEITSSSDDIAHQRLTEFDRNGGATMTVQDAAARFERELAARRTETLSRLDAIDRDGEEPLPVESAFAEFRQIINEQRRAARRARGSR
jgi:hypothetical protein